ncbi:MAG: gliding motility-associated C-terminal domain-containing protein [Brumimicrobium sp.]|nr:gliding motility-associated C-terminal domain-containing protein [Brumimicrobium sp.]
MQKKLFPVNLKFLGSLIFLSFSPIFSVSQESYNNCSNALELCPGVTQTANNIDANSTLCANCEDDFNFCFSGENTVWFTFQTNAAGGDVTVDFTNINFQNDPGQGNNLQAVVIEASVPCVSSSYTVVSNCVNNGGGNFTLTANGLTPETTFYVIVNGEMGTTANAEATFDVEVNGPGVERNPAFSIGANTTTACLGQQVIFNASVMQCDDQSVIDWYANGELIASTVEPEFVTTELSDGDVISATITCFEQCPQELTSNQINMNIITFLVDAGPDLVIDEGESVQLQGNSDVTNIQWSPAVAMSNPNILDPVVAPGQTITYFLTGNNGTCTITDEMTVTVLSGLVIPNTFSPNGDGINDTWEILGIEKYVDVSIKIYDRWGQLVFITTGYPVSKRWDGTSKSGKELAPSAYYYVIDLRDDKYPDPFKGYVTILK